MNSIKDVALQNISSHCVQPLKQNQQYINHYGILFLAFYYYSRIYKRSIKAMRTKIYWSQIQSQESKRKKSSKVSVLQYLGYRSRLKPFNSVKEYLYKLSVYRFLIDSKSQFYIIELGLTLRYRSLEQFILTVGQNNFGNKIPLSHHILLQ